MFLKTLDHVALHGHVQTFGHSFGKGNGPILLDNVICTGSETSILTCLSNGLYQHNCAEDHSEDAAVICNGNYKVRCGHKLVYSLFVQQNALKEVYAYYLQQLVTNSIQIQIDLQKATS